MNAIHKLAESCSASPLTCPQPTVPPVTPEPTTTTTTIVADQLALTGSNTQQLLMFAAVLIILGAIALWYTHNQKDLTS